MGAGRLTILMSGMMAGDPYQGGATWAVLQYLLGFRRLGHEVFFVEPVKAAALQPPGVPLEGSSNALSFLRVAREFGLEGKAALVLAETRHTFGLAYEQLRQAAAGADVLINISGVLADDDLTGPIPVRVYLDLDPAFNQLWQAAEGIDMHFAGHTHHVTIGLAIGQADCPVPTCGRAWITTRQPVVLEHWPVARNIIHDGLTTVGNWRGYGSIDYQGVFYGQKVHSWRQFMSLPGQTAEKLMPALAIHPGESKDIAALAENGWRWLDAAAVAATPAAYRQFIQGSKGEIGIAKSGYALARCGWFSDRSICYLASGRPVIAQETGFSRFLPTGKGLFSFTTCAEAVAAIETMNRDYPGQARAARAMAEEFFDSDKVLAQFLQRIGVAP